MWNNVEARLNRATISDARLCGPTASISQHAKLRLGAIPESRHRSALADIPATPLRTQRVQPRNSPRARIALNYHSAPKGFFHVFNEAHTVVYELILAGADIGEKNVVDISIGQHWSKYWTDNDMSSIYGARAKYPHCYPDSHPQSKSNPQEFWCYPLASLGAYREWLQDVYIEGGKFSTYLKGKVLKGELALSVAQLAIAALIPPQIAGPTA